MSTWMLEFAGSVQHSSGLELHESTCECEYSASYRPGIAQSRLVNHRLTPKVPCHKSEHPELATLDRCLLLFGRPCRAKKGKSGGKTGEMRSKTCKGVGVTCAA